LDKNFKTGNKFELWVFQENIRAIRFYEKNGFILVEKTNGERNEEKVPDAKYIWSH
jgi:RimJ/RimL family protein N-acetyltransferase